MKVRALARRAVDQARTGDRSVYALPEWAGLGNQLFFLLWGALQQRNGMDFRIVRSQRSDSSLEAFSTLRDELTISRDQVRIKDKRARSQWDVMPGKFDQEDRDWFIGRYLMPSGFFDLAPDTADELTINIRRGDYYSDPDVRGRFSFDQIAYLNVILERLADQRQDRRFSRIKVVSDDLEWCRTRLGFLQDSCEELAWGSSGGPLDDLATIAAARNLIITNSTFSIWGAYISNYLHGHRNDANVWAPAFGTRPFTGEPWESLDPRWNIVKDIPGGWDS